MWGANNTAKVDLVAVTKQNTNRVQECRTIKIAKTLLERHSENPVSFDYTTSTASDLKSAFYLFIQWDAALISVSKITDNKPIGLRSEVSPHLYIAPWVGLIIYTEGF